MTAPMNGVAPGVGVAGCTGGLLGSPVGTGSGNDPVGVGRGPCGNGANGLGAGAGVDGGASGEGATIELRRYQFSEVPAEVPPLKR